MSSTDPGDGDSSDGYTKVRVLGRGSFGEAVLYAKDSGELVVWKEISVEKLTAEQRAETENEIEIISSLSHPNIVAYRQHFLEPKTLYIEMAYADGGSLYHLICGRGEDLLGEEGVLWYFYQMCSALHYMHERGVWHRDLKTLNVFMTSTDLCLLGDFGMSKVLGKKEEKADSCVGTPYYMSPEMVKGEPYDERADVWALGCCLHEMLTLTRTFHASNTLKLASIIVRGDFSPVDKSYSEEMTQLVTMCLQKDMADRCTTDELLATPIMRQNMEEYKSRIASLCPSYGEQMTCSPLCTSATASTLQPLVTRSTSRLLICRSGVWHRIPLDVGASSSTADSTEQCVGVALGGKHTVVVNGDRHVYTFAQEHDTQFGADGMVGQLGHGDMSAYKAPRRVSLLASFMVNRVACGTDFTLALTDDGAVYSFGSNYEGTLGVDDESIEQSLIPLRVPFTVDGGQSVRIRRISAGERHCAATSEEGHVFVWGCGEWGRLGLGAEHEVPAYAPRLVHIPSLSVEGGQRMRPICSVDATFLLTSGGLLLATGTNTGNKLGLNRKANIGAQLTYDVDYVSVFRRVRCVDQLRVADLASCATHTVVCTENGQCFTFGCNEHGQLGAGHTRSMGGRPYHVSLDGRVIRVACADGVCAVATDDGIVHMWGLRVAHVTNSYNNALTKGTLAIQSMSFHEEDKEDDLRVRQLLYCADSVAAIVQLVTHEAAVNGEGAQETTDGMASTRKVTDDPLPQWLLDELDGASVIRADGVPMTELASVRGENDVLRGRVDLLTQRVHLLEARLFAASLNNADGDEFNV